MTFRTLSRIALTTGLLLALALASATRADPTGTPAPQSPGVPATAPPHQADLAGFDLLAGIGYGVATSRIATLAVEPYGASLGLETGYTFRRGVRLGLYAHYGLGRSHDSTYRPLVGDAFDVTIDARGLTSGASVGYDLPIGCLVLRYSLNLGLSWMHWKFSDLPVRPLAGFDKEEGSALGFHVAPGLSVLWPYRKLVVGLGFDYWIQVDDHMPPGLLTKLLLGVKL